MAHSAGALLPCQPNEGKHYPNIVIIHNKNASNMNCGQKINDRSFRMNSPFCGRPSNGKALSAIHFHNSVSKMCRMRFLLIFVNLLKQTDKRHYIDTNMEMRMGWKFRRCEMNLHNRHNFCVSAFRPTCL